METERSSNGTASRASEGETLGEGELGRCAGEVTVLSGGLIGISAIVMRLAACALRLHGCGRLQGCTKFLSRSPADVALSTASAFTYFGGRWESVSVKSRSKHTTCSHPHSKGGP